MKQYTVYVRLRKGKKQVNYIDDFNISEAIKLYFPCIVEAKNKESALELGNAIARDINKYLPKCIVITAVSGI